MYLEQKDNYQFLLWPKSTPEAQVFWDSEEILYAVMSIIQ